MARAIAYNNDAPTNFTKYHKALITHKNLFDYTLKVIFHKSSDSAIDLSRVSLACLQCAHPEQCIRVKHRRLVLWAQGLRSAKACVGHCSQARNKSGCPTCST